MTIPNAIVKHIAHSAALACPPNVLKSYDTSGTRWRHITIIRDYLSINPYQAKARKLIVRSMGQAARTKNDLADIINVAIEELVHHRYELPVFNTLVRAGKRVRGTVDRAFYRQVRQHLNSESCQNLDSLFVIGESASKTPWHELKQDPGKPILKNLKALVWRLKWLSQLNTYQDALEHIPNVKLKYFATRKAKLCQSSKTTNCAYALRDEFRCCQNERARTQQTLHFSCCIDSYSIRTYFRRLSNDVYQADAENPR